MDVAKHGGVYGKLQMADCKWQMGVPDSIRDAVHMPGGWSPARGARLCLLVAITSR